jgi:hypothetical protein
MIERSCLQDACNHEGFMKGSGSFHEVTTAKARILPGNFVLPLSGSVHHKNYPHRAAEIKE